MSRSARFASFVLCVAFVGLGPPVTPAAAEPSSPPSNGLFDRTVTDTIPSPHHPPIAAGSDLLVPTGDGFSIQAGGFTSGLTPRYSYTGTGDVALGYDGYWVVFGSQTVPTVVGARAASIAVPDCDDATITAAHAVGGIGFVGCHSQLVAVDLDSAYSPTGPRELGRVGLGDPIISIDHVPDASGLPAKIVVATSSRTMLIDPGSWSITQTLPPAVDVPGGHPTSASPDRLWLAHDAGWQRYEPVGGTWGARGAPVDIDLLVDLGDLVVGMEGRGSMVFWSTRDLAAPIAVEPRLARVAMLTGRWRNAPQRFWGLDIDGTGTHTASMWDDRGCTIIGTLDADVLIGTSGDDVLCGLGGDDILMGLGGDDASYGGIGDDVQYGGSGADRMWGEAGRDLLDGGSDDDVIWLTNGNDTAFAGAGDDRVHVRSSDAQTVFTGSGDDVVELEERAPHWIYSGVGNDWVTSVELPWTEPGTLAFLGDGDDRLNCGGCTAHGGPGADVLETTGFQGVEFLGGPGDDTLNGARGRDRLWGGPGCDSIRFGPEDEYWANNSGIDGCVIAR